MTRDLGPASRPRCALVWLAVTATVGGAAAGLVPHVRDVRTDRFDLLLVTACEVAVLCTAAWVWLVTTVVALDAARGSCRERRGVPAPLRRALLLACGVALAGGLSTPSYAGPRLPAGDERPGVAVLEGLPLPDRVTAATAVARLVAAQTAHPRGGRDSRPPTEEPDKRATPARHVVVTAGDTLWAIAAASLPPGASTAQVATAVERLYAANRATVGADPDLIVPGQVLRLPGSVR